MTGPRSRSARPDAVDIGDMDDLDGTEGSRRSGHAGLRTLVRVLDDVVTIPGTNIRFGLDALIGLVPGLGDVSGGVMSGLVILAASRAGAPAPIIARMVGNAAIDMIVGAVPILGDMFDVAWKANRKNLNLLDRYLEQPSETKRASAAFVIGALIVLLLLLAGSILLAVMMVRALMHWGAT